MREVPVTTTLNGILVRRETIELYEWKRTIITAPKKGRATRRHKTKRPKGK